MSKRIVAAVALVLPFAFVACSSAPQQTAPAVEVPAYVGSWVADIAASDVAAFRVAIEGDPAGEMTMFYGGSSYKFRMDGKEYDIQGMTASWKQTGPRTWETVYRLKGVVNNTDTFTLSDDDARMVMATDRVGPPATKERLDLVRKGTGKGLVGEWQVEKADMEGIGMEISQVDATHTRLVFRPQNAEVLAPNDGTRVKVTGAPEQVPDGSTASFKAVGPNEYFMTQWIGEEQIATGPARVSADGKTLTAEVTLGPPGGAQNQMRQVYRRK